MSKSLFNSLFLTLFIIQFLFLEVYSGKMLRAVDFEVFGKVQGVFFRKFTKEKADTLGLKGWCKNTSQGTVLGHAEGPSDNIKTMMNWLEKTGSPSSSIEKAVFKNEKDLTQYTFNDFTIKKD